MLELLVWLLVFVVVVWLVFTIMGHLPLPEPVRTVATAIVALLLLLILLSQTGLLGRSLP